MSVTLDPPRSPAEAAAQRIVCRELIVAHEVGHLAGEILWTGMVPARVEVAPFAGNVRTDWTRYSLSREKAPALIRAVVAGPVAAGDPAPRWPFLSTLSNDEKALHALTRFAGIEQDGYDRLVIDTYNRMCEPEFRHLEVIFGCVLEHRTPSTATRFAGGLDAWTWHYIATNGDDAP